MAGNTFGKLLRLTTFGESHGPAIGGILDGFPAGIDIDTGFIQKELARRKPGQSTITTSRNEEDAIEILSGIFNGKSTGTPIAFQIRNKDQQTADYDKLKEVYRPGHADKVYDEKYGVRDFRGGGRSSARETISRVAAGALAKLLLTQKKISVVAFVSSVKDVSIEKPYNQLDLSLIESNPVRCPDKQTAEKMIQVIDSARNNKDSVGGTITCICQGIPAGLGEPVFDKLNAVLAHAMFSINAVKGVEFDGGFNSSLLFGSQNNPLPSGITGGISTGNDIVLRIAFKPVSSIGKSQIAEKKSGEQTELSIEGRHDPCVLPRAVPIVEAMAALVLADYLLLRQADGL